MTIYNLKDKLEYLDEVARLQYEEWADNKEENKEETKNDKKDDDVIDAEFVDKK